MLLLRDVRRNDLSALQKLAAVLNTVNLPDNRTVLRQVIEKSVLSFAGRITNPFEREYLFVLEDTAKKRLIGTSMIIAQHGTYEAPHIYFQVTEAEHYSASLNRHFRHQVLSIGYNYEGPTEIGGLVVAPAFRSGDEKPGKQLSYVRFLFMAMHRKLFRPRVLAELLPPLLPDGRSLLWECVGKKFTGLSYKEADRLSRKNKEFIKELFPSSDLYATLLPEKAQKLIGEVGQETHGVRRMLERIGFHYVHHIDPFDGGPHFEANIEDVSLVRHHVRARVAPRPLKHAAEPMLVGVDRDFGTNRFRAVRCEVELKQKIATLPLEAAQALGVGPGDRISVIPFE